MTAVLASFDLGAWYTWAIPIATALIVLTLVGLMLTRRGGTD